jgi:hypothetical protein
LPALLASIARARARLEPSVHLVSRGAHRTVSVDTAEVPLAVRLTASPCAGEITQSVNVVVFWTLRSEGPWPVAANTTPGPVGAWTVHPERAVATWTLSVLSALAEIPIPKPAFTEELVREPPMRASAVGVLGPAANALM